MASYRTAVLREEDGNVPKVLRAVLPEGTPASSAGNHFRALPWLRNDEDLFRRRYAVDVRAEFRRAMARRRFFTFWQPEMETSRG